MRWVAILAVCAAPAFGQTVTMPKEVSAPVGRLATVVVESDGADTKYFTDGDLDLFREYDADPKVIRLRVIGYAAGKYTLRAITCRDNRLSDPAVCTVVIGKPADPPPVIDPPKDPPAQPEVRYYFAVVRPDGPVQPAVADSLRLAAWDEVKKAGHTVKDIPVSELPTGLDRPTSLPVVIVLRYNADGKTQTDTKQNRPLPTTDEQVRGLIK